MKRNTCFAWVLAFLLVLTPLCARSADAELAEVWESATGGRSVQEWLDTELAAQAGGAADNFALCLLRSGAALDFSAYAEAIAAKLEEGISNANTRMRAALCLLACGEDIPADIVDDGAGKLGVMSWVWALHLLNNGAPSEQFTAESVAGKLLELQLEDGGWRVSGDAGDVDVTCMVLQALSYCEPKSEALNTAIERALSFLSERQRDSGGFASMGEENAESAAQVLIALSGLNIAPDDPRFVKNSRTALDAMLDYQLPTGGFEHLSGSGESPIATAQALQALIALEMPGEAFYDFMGAKATEKSPEKGTQAEQQPAQGVDSDAANSDSSAQGISGAQSGASTEGVVSSPQEAQDSAETNSEHSKDTSLRSDENADLQGGASNEESIAAPQDAQDSAKADSEHSGDASPFGDEIADAQGGVSQGGVSTEASIAAPQETQDSAEASAGHPGGIPSNGDSNANTGVQPPASRQAALLAVSSSPKLPVWKLCAFSAIGALALAGVVFALTRKRARGKHLLAVLLIAAVAAGAVWFVRVDSASDYYDPNALSSANADGSVTLSIRCDSVAGRADDGSTPADGAILPPTQIPFAEGDSVFDALTTAARANSIQLEYEGAEAMAYVTGINYLYEFDYGELSGWQYSVNGERVSLSCGSCALHDGDEILWEYTTDLGGGLR